MTDPTPRSIRSVSPYNKQLLAEFPCADAAAVEQSVQKAQQRFAAGTGTLKERLAKILKLRSIIARKADEIASLISTEVGKPLAEAYSAEIAGVLDTCFWLASEAPDILDTKRIKLANPLAFGKQCFLTYEPLGVIGIISPWNFPFSIPIQSVLQAVAAGNTVVLKPSEKSSLVALRIKELFDEAGFPEGTVNVILGDGMTGKLLSEARLGRLILTGSVRAGQRILEQTANNLTPVTLELGGKDAAIVLPDAPVDFTAKGLVWGAFTNAGQACASIERIYVVRGPNTEALIAKVVELTRGLKVGPPTAQDIDVGAIIDQAQLDKIDHQVTAAKGMGATVLTGGRKIEDSPGFFYEPTVLTGVDHTMLVMTEETFGPVLAIMVVDNVDEAVRLANDSTFGLTASIWTAAQDKAKSLAPKLNVGIVYVNDCIFSHAAPELPWGGVKNSGIGRSHGPIGLLDMVNIKNFNVDSSGGNGRMWWYPYNSRALSTVAGGIQLLHGSFPFGRIRGLATVIGGYLFKKTSKRPPK